MSLKQPHQVQSTTASNENAEGELGLSDEIKIKQPVHNWQLLIAIAALFGLGFVLGQKFQLPQATIESVAKTQTNILPVKTTVIEPVRSYSTTQTYTGEVTALRTSEVGFERAGKLIEVFVEEGDRVTANAPLAKLDTTNLEAQRQGLIARQEQARAVLAELENGARTEEIAAAQANVRDLQQQLELEKLRSSRREYLYGEGA